MLKKAILKGISLAMVSTLLLTGCTTSSETNSTKTDMSSTESTADTADTADTTDADATSTGKTKIVYGGWENEYIINELAKKFMETHPNIEIEIFNNGTWLGNENTQKLVASGQMPDIINLQNPSYPIQNDWVVDLKPYLDKEENLEIPQNFIDYCTINGKVIMLPSAAFLDGVYLNKDLLEANNVKIPSYDWTFDEYVNIAKKTTKDGSTIGTSQASHLLQTLPAQMNPDLGWAAFNDKTKQYQLTPEWAEIANLCVDLVQSNSTLFERLDKNGNPWDLEDGSDERAKVEEARKQFLLDATGEDDAEKVWTKGKMALKPDFSWGITFDDTDLNPDYTGFEWDYYPFPVKKAGDISRPAMLFDSIAITTSCKNPDEAYEFLKYMTFDPQAVTDRIEIIDNYDQDEAKAMYPDMNPANIPGTIAFQQMPCTTNKEVLDKWVEYNNFPDGVQYMLDHMDTAFIDGFKVTPGYAEAYNDIILKGYTEQILTGEKTVGDLATELEEKANQVTNEIMAEIENK